MYLTRFQICHLVFAAFFLICGSTQQTFAQSKELVLIFAEDADADVLKKIKAEKYSKVYGDSLLRYRALRELLINAYDEGCLEASYDSVVYESNKIAKAYFNIGPSYQWQSLKLSDEIRNITGVNEISKKRRAVSPEAISKLYDRILTNSENNGYPFAEVWLDSIDIGNAVEVSAKLNFDKGELVILDSVIVKGNSKLSLTYLYNYLSIKPGDIYNEALVRKSSVRIEEIPFITEVKPFEVVFVENKARLILYIDERGSNTIDGIIGLLPDAEDKRKLNLTGEASISLRNSFHRGEILDLRWKQQRPGTQDLKIKAAYPFLFKTPFGAEARLHIYKQDTTFIDLERRLGIQYFLRGGNYFQVYFEGRESSLLSTKTFENATVLPEFADVSFSSYGIGYLSEKLDYRFNPRRGYSVELSGSAGKKTISKNSKLNPELYDSLNLRTNVYKFDMNFEYYFPLAELHVVNFGLNGALLVAEEIFSNELYRFGGLKTLRGFDEEIIRATKYGIWTLEYRYILEQNSFLFLFVNGAWYENDSRDNKIEDRPIGFGAGINFETRLGIFSFNYALGKEFDNNFVFRTAKLHFGIVNYF